MSTLDDLLQQRQWITLAADAQCGQKTESELHLGSKLEEEQEEKKNTEEWK